MNQQRRMLLVKAMKLAALAMLPKPLLVKAQTNPKLIDYPFKLGVACGDPLQDGFVIWTRLAPNPLDCDALPNAPIKVSWRISLDEKGTNIIQSGSVLAYPQNAHSVHVEVKALESNTQYFYQFSCAGEHSAIGRVYTLPMVGQPTPNFRFAVASCQSYTDGHYAAYRDMVEQEPRLIIHTGDYIYEQDWIGGIRSIPVKEATTLDEYRMLYATYKLDPSLQSAHASAAWLAIWDDHEIDNDWGGEYSQDSLSPEEFLQRKTAAFKAYFEHMPLRVAARPNHGSVKLYQRTIVGDLIQFDLLDCRQYRDLPACGNEIPLLRGYKAMCDDAKSTERSLLGKEQEDWLFRGLGYFNCKWNALIQTTMLAPFDFVQGKDRAFDMDGWDNFDATRQRILDQISMKKLSNPLSFGGNIHAFYAGIVNQQPHNVASVPLLTELVCSSITSGGGGDERYQSTLSQFAENSFAQYFENRQRGYILCDLSHSSLVAELRVVQNINDPHSTSSTLVTLTIKDGVVGIKTT